MPPHTKLHGVTISDIDSLFLAVLARRLGWVRSSSVTRAPSKPTRHTSASAFHDSPLSFFISGHIDISAGEFNAYYAPVLTHIVRTAADPSPLVDRVRESLAAATAPVDIPGPKEMLPAEIPQISATPIKVAFVVGDADGTDITAQRLLVGDLQVPLSSVTVYHQGSTPRFIAEKRIRCINAFESHKAKDAAMTAASTHDVAWVRDEEAQKELYGDRYRPRVSGTEHNLARRARNAAATTSAPQTSPTQAAPWQTTQATANNAEELTARAQAQKKSKRRVQ